MVILVGFAVRVTSSGPVLFRQRRMGRAGQEFTIYKFRTMAHSTAPNPCLVTTAGDSRFTRIGPFLRRWKLDEFPQLFNVLQGEMSLVGPRPKVCEQTQDWMACRPGVTGAATIAFAREEQALDRIPRQQLTQFYRDVVVPAKQQIDSEYMAQATLSSDLRLIWSSVFGQWNGSVMEQALCQAAGQQDWMPSRSENRRRAPLGLGAMEVGNAESDSVA